MRLRLHAVDSYGAECLARSGSLGLPRSSYDCTTTRLGFVSHCSIVHSLNAQGKRREWWFGKVKFYLQVDRICWRQISTLEPVTVLSQFKDIKIGSM